MPGRGGTLSWAVGGSAVAVVLVALLWLGPLLPFGVLAVVGALFVAVVAPQLLVALTLVLVLFSTPLQSLVGGSAAALDDGAVVFCVVVLPVRRLVTERRLVWLPGAAWFAAFVGVGLISGVAEQVPPGILLPGAFLAVKGLLLAFAAAQVPWSVEHLRRAIRGGVWVVVLIVLSGLANLVAPVAWSTVVGTRVSTGPYGLPALTGIFSRAGAFSRFCGVLALAALSYRLVVRRSRFALVAFITCTGLAFSTLQVKSVLGLIATITLMCLPFLTRKRALQASAFLPVVAVVAAVPLVQLVTADVDSYVLQDSARSMLTKGGATVANATFPLGAGFGRFGSSTAAENYSPWYYTLNFQNRFGLAPGADSGQFLNDSQWPALYGEAGWIGAACFAVGMICMFVHLARGLRREEEPLVRWLHLAGGGWMLLLLAESLAAPVFVSAPSYPFVFLASAVAAGIQRRPTSRQAPRPRHRTDDEALAPRAG